MGNSREDSENADARPKQADTMVIPRCRSEKSVDRRRGRSATKRPKSTPAHRPGRPAPQTDRNHPRSPKRPHDPATSQFQPYPPNAPNRRHNAGLAGKVANRLKPPDTETSARPLLGPILTPPPERGEANASQSHSSTMPAPPTPRYASRLESHACTCTSHPHVSTPQRPPVVATCQYRSYHVLP